jgi:CheY-like chemotaxis protein
MAQIAGIAALRIMIVEDEGIIANEIESMLQRAGYEVAGIAASSEEVFAKVPELHPDLILMDIHIDGLLDGIQTAAKLLERFDIPIIYLSAYTDPETIARATATGAFEFLTKPLNRAKLVTAIEGATQRHCAAGGNSARAKAS